MPLGKMKWSEHWVQGFKCLEIYFQIAFANHIKYKYVLGFRFFISFDQTATMVMSSISVHIASCLYVDDVIVRDW